MLNVLKDTPFPFPSFLKKHFLFRMTKRSIDQAENDAIHKFMEDGCNCHNDCSSLFGVTEYESHCQIFIKIVRSEKDLLVLSFLHFNLAHKSKEERMKFYKDGKLLCRKTFLFLCDMSLNLFYSLIAHRKRISGKNTWNQEQDAIQPSCTGDY